MARQYPMKFLDGQILALLRHKIYVSTAWIVRDVLIIDGRHASASMIRNALYRLENDGYLKKKRSDDGRSFLWRLSSRVQVFSTTNEVEHNGTV